MVESDRKRDIPGGGCREDARVHYEGINVHARRAVLDARAPAVLVGPEVQSPVMGVPDLSKLNSVPGPRASGPPQVPRRTWQQY